jgi:hypothetical protein
MHGANGHVSTMYNQDEQSTSSAYATGTRAAGQTRREIHGRRQNKAQATEMALVEMRIIQNGLAQRSQVSSVVSGMPLSLHRRENMHERIVTVIESGNGLTVSSSLPVIMCWAQMNLRS